VESCGDGFGLRGLRTASKGSRPGSETPANLPWWLMAVSAGPDVDTVESTISAMRVPHRDAVLAYPELNGPCRHTEVIPDVGQRLAIFVKRECLITV